jgi:hypothetical protein
MELSSLLAGEGFTDRPRCVDGVLAAYMRALNDRLGARDRQRLLPYAARAVGTAGDGHGERRRAACLRFVGIENDLRARLRLMVGVGLIFGAGHPEPAAELAARRVTATRDADRAFDLLEELLGSEAAPLAGPVAQLPELRVPSRVGQLEVEPQRAQ